MEENKIKKSLGSKTVFVNLAAHLGHISQDSAVRQEGQPAKVGGHKP